MIEENLFKEINKIKEKNLEKPIAIQIPEGLKQYSLKILDELKEFDPILFVDPCFGACDLKDKESKEFGCKTLIHFGHYRMGNPLIKTLFVPINYKLNDKEINYIINWIKNKNFKKINLTTTIQYLSNIEDIKKKLIKENIEVIESRETNRLKKHMVLGCDCSNILDRKHPIIFIGDGNFHANNLAFIYNNQKTYAINPITRTYKEIKIKEEFIKRRYILISVSKSAKTFGILVSKKSGQKRLELAKEIKIKLEKHNRKAYILVSDYIKEEYLYGIKVDCYVNTACPRISYDDFNLFKKPILSATEINIVLDIKKELKIDQIN